MIIINYLLECSVCLIALYAVFHIWMQQEKLPRLNRVYLIFALIISFIIPFIQITLPAEQAPLLWNDYVVGSSIISENIYQVSNVSAFQWTLRDTLLSIYVIGVLVMIGRFSNSCFKVFTLINNGKIIAQNGYQLVLIEKPLPVFSFLNYIFLNKNHDYSEKDLDIILEHEKAHIKEKHSWDILMCEMTKTLFWFNPIIYLYQQKLKEIHEYLADEAVTHSTCDAMEYVDLMMHEARKHSAQVLPITHFFHNQIKKRLVMMSKIKQPQRGFKTFFCLPVILALVLVFSVNGEMFGQSSSSSSSSTAKKEAKSAANYIRWSPPSFSPTPSSSVRPGVGCSAECSFYTSGKETKGWEPIVCPKDITNTFLEDVTAALKKKGFAVGKVLSPEGDKPYRLDNATKNALMQYQKLNGLPIGQLDFKTLQSLNVMIGC